MEDRAKKIRKTLSSVGLSTNQRQLAKILNTLSRQNPQDLDELLSSKRWRLKSAVDAFWREVGIEVALEITPTQHFNLPCSSLPKLMHAMVRDSPAFLRLFRELWMQKPCSQVEPYHLVIYGDEFTPGQVLRQDNKRKMFSCLVSIAEFGPTILKLNAAWIPMYCIRHDVARTIPGGASYVFRMFLRQLYLEDRVGANGIVLPVSTPVAAHIVLYFTTGNLVFDGDALRMILGWKGAKGKLPCPGCLNVIAQDDELPSDQFVRLTCADADKFVAATNDDVWMKADTLAAAHGAIGIGAFKHLETALGFTYIPQGLLYDRDLRSHVRPVDCLTLDQMHCLLSDGLAQDEVSCVLYVLHNLGDTWANINTFMQADWHFCSVHTSGRRAIRTAFSVHREKHFKKTWSFSPGASDMYAIYPILGHYLDRVARPTYGEELDLAIDSYHALGCVIALAKEGKQDAAHAAQLLRACSAHMRKFLLAYPDKHITPKGHWTFHIARQMERDGFVMDCFVGERSGKMFKACAMQVTFQAEMDSGYEEAVLKRCLVHYFSMLEEPDLLRDHLDTPTRHEELAAMFGARDAYVSLSMTWTGTPVCERDIVLLDGSPFLVIGCVCLDGNFALVAQTYEYIGQATRYTIYIEREEMFHNLNPAHDGPMTNTNQVGITASRWRSSPNPWTVERLVGRAFRFAVAWHEEPDGSIVIISL